MDDHAKNIGRRVYRHWFADGIIELAGGGWLLVLGLYFLGQDFLQPDSPASLLWAGSLWGVVLFGVVIASGLVRFLKARLVYPRTGYVEFRPGGKEKFVRGILISIIAMGISMTVLAVGYWIAPFHWTTGLAGMVACLVFLMFRAGMDGLERFVFLAVFSLALGLVLTFIHTSTGWSVGLFCGLLGIVLMFSGGLTLARYLHENQLPAEEA